MADPWTHFWYYGQQQHSPYAQPQGAQLYYTPAAGTMPLPMVQQGPQPPMWAQQQQGQMMVAPQMNLMTPVGTHAHKLVNGYQSAKYPLLHPTLAPDTSAIRYDLRKPPKEGIHHPWYHQTKSAFAFAKPYQSIRLVSADFPWSIDIKTGQSPITVEYIWDALYQCLQQEMADSEWGILALPGGDRKRRDTIAKAREKRLEANKNDKVKKPRKIDWLGESTFLKGLDIDDDFADKRAVPGEDDVEEVWVVRMVGP